MGENAFENACGILKKTFKELLFKKQSIYHLPT